MMKIYVFTYAKLDFQPYWFSKKVFFYICLLAIFWMLHYYVYTYTNYVYLTERVKTPSKKELKYMLLWTAKEYSPFYFFGVGQNVFIRNNCTIKNCYITYDRNFFKEGITKFDAIAFNGRNHYLYEPWDLPRTRLPHQKYIYVNLETPSYAPECSKYFENFFNWTATYRLDSDIPFPYLSIVNKNGETVGPKTDMVWENIASYVKIDNNTFDKLHRKSKTAAWFASHCSTDSHREVYVYHLQIALQSYGFWIDKYGKCGQLKCPVQLSKVCDKKIEEYYFYLAFENSFSEDYVTEKLLRALNHFAVPVVLGDANYTRFLPPGSYISARRKKPKRLASEMAKLILNPELYREYFRWRAYYTYRTAFPKDNICKLCAVLNNRTLMETTTVYREFRKWWNPNYEKDCINI